MNDPLNIVVIEGTTRVQRKSIHVSHLIEQIGQEIEGITITFVDPVDYVFPGDGNDPEGQDPRYEEIIKHADGFFIVVPEYNHSFPGSLKRLLDSGTLKSYIHKPVAFAGVSSGGWGGVRGVESLVAPVREMGLVATFSMLYFPRVNELFNERGELTDESYREKIVKSYDELIWMAKALKTARETTETV